MPGKTDVRAGQLQCDTPSAAPAEHPLAQTAGGNKRRAACPRRQQGGWASGWRTHFTVLIAGILHATSFAPQPLPAALLPFVQLLTMAALVRLVWRAYTVRHAASLGFAFGLGHFATGLYWMHTSIHQYGGVAWMPAALAVLLLAAFLALYYACACALAWRLSPHAGRGRFDGLIAALAWASAVTLLEWLRGTLLTGFPWLNIAYAHVDSVFSAWASSTGAYGVAWLAALAAASLALLAPPRTHGWAGGRGRGHPALPALILVAVLAASGVLLASIPWTTPHGAATLVRLIQGNLDPQEKFNPHLLPRHLEMYRTLAALPPKDGSAPPQLIVLPETAIPILQNRLPAEEWQRWIALARTQEATILMGVPVRSTRAGSAVDSNSVLLIDRASSVAAIAEGTAPRYDKSHLVPFGEFIPTGFRWFVEAMTIPLGDFQRGQPRQPLFSVAGQTIAINICYEDVFGEEIAQTVRASAAYDDAGASLLVNTSDLAWFGHSWAQRQQLQMARMRSQETARPMLRATNTGMTAAISPQGVVYAQLDAHALGVLDVEVQGQTGFTPYVRWGNTPILLWLAASLGVLAAHTRARPIPDQSSCCAATSP